MKKRTMILIAMSFLLAALMTIVFAPIPYSWIDLYISSNNVRTIKLIARLRPSLKYNLMDYASGQDKPEIVVMLLKEGVNVNGKDLTHGGWTPLYRAATQQADKCIELLLKEGADPNILVPWSYDTAIFALTPPFGEEKHPTSYERKLKFFFEHGADPNAVDKYGNTLLHKRFSESNGSFYYGALYPLFRQYGYNPKIKNKKGQTIVDILELENTPDHILIQKIKQDITQK